MTSQADEVIRTLTVAQHGVVMRKQLGGCGRTDGHSRIPREGRLPRAPHYLTRPARADVLVEATEPTLVELELDLFRAVKDGFVRHCDGAGKGAALVEPKVKPGSAISARVGSRRMVTHHVEEK